MAGSDPSGGSREAFSDPQAVARYAENPPRLVPGFADMQRMAMVLLAERTPPDARILVLGAGGGLELKVFTDARPGWSFVGIDPAGPMLDLARTTLGDAIGRVDLHNGYIDDAPPGPFDAGCSILTLHFIPAAERLRTLAEVRRRLKPGAPFVAAHFSIEAGRRDLWLARYAAFAVASCFDPAQAEAARSGISQRLPILTPAEDEAVLRQAGFQDIAPFYMGFAFRGWVAAA